VAFGRHGMADMASRSPGFRTKALRVELPGPWWRRVRLSGPAAVVVGLAVCARAADGPPPFPVSIHVEANRPLGELRPIWRFFGADEPNYAYMKDGRALLADLGALRHDDVFFRAHNLLTTGDGTPALKWGSTNAYTEDAQGRPVYDWTIVDRIFDTYRARGVRPYVEIGFMPEALSVHPEPYQHGWRPGSGELFTGWSYPPKDYAKWAELVTRWVAHCVERYGRDEVERWYWETWNEANIAYWHGTRDEFFRLHDITVDAVRRALPTARVGGPDMAGSDRGYLSAFLARCLHDRTPLDFISFHAKGSPSLVDGHVEMGIAAQLQTIASGFETVASFTEARRLPIVIGESDPEGCAACRGPRYAYRNGTMYSSYTAAVLARIHDLAARYRVNVEGALTWAFEFEDQPYFPGFRALATNGIALPVLNVFRMFSRMAGERVAVASSREVALDAIVAGGVRDAPDVSALASRDSRRVAILVWHYHDDDVPGPAADVRLECSGLPANVREALLTHYRVDQSHSNAYAAWKRMGAPVAPDPEQYAQMKVAGTLAALEKPRRVPVLGGVVPLRFRLPRQGVSLVVLDWSESREE
jgi:xylan 1,4-beta-xylosidase